MADESLLVGETDGQNFGVGQAPKDSRANKADLVNMTKRNRSKAAGKIS